MKKIVSETNILKTPPFLLLTVNRNKIMREENLLRKFPPRKALEQNVN